MAERISTLTEFWPYYLREHQSPTCRVLHFFGTGGFFASLVYAFVTSPVTMAIVTPIVALEMWVGSQKIEARKPAFLPLGVAVLLLLFAAPEIGLGILSAYAAAWIGHFLIEHNRPATFQYPMWSLICDFRMWGQMATGKLWTGKPAF